MRFAKWLLFMVLAAVYATTLKVVTLPWEPYDFMEVTKEGEVPRGIDLELTVETLKRMGYDVEVTFMPWGRCLAAMASKQADVIVSAYYKPDRERYLIYPKEPLNYSVFAIFYRNDSGITIYKDIIGKTMAYVESYYYGRDFEKLPVVKVPVKSDLIAFKMLAAGRVDLVVEDYFVGKILLKKLGLDDYISVMLVPSILKPLATYAAFAKKPGYEKLAEEFSKVLKEVKREKQRKLIDEYVGNAELYWRIIMSFSEVEKK